MQLYKELSGKTALVTGASRGIGYETAEELARHGVTVMAVARSEKELKTLTERIKDSGGHADFYACDVANYAEIEAAIAATRTRFDGLDLLINNAGVIEPIGSIATVNPNQWSSAIDVNLKGVFFAIRAALPIMQAQGAGVIVNVSSGAAHAPLEGWSHYCAGKAGVAMLTRATHLENEAKGIRVVGLSPGTVATRMQVVIKESGINPVSQLDPSVHIDAAWPAKAIAWLCSDDAKEFDGQEVSLRDESVRSRVGLVDNSA